MGFTLSCVEASASTQRYEINITATDATTALNMLASQTDSPLLFDFDQLRGLRVNSLQGTYTLKEALDLILRDSGFSGNLMNREVITISPIKPIETQKEEDPMIFKGTKKNLLTSASAALVAAAATPIAAQAQDVNNDEVIATGIRQSLSNAIAEKRETTNLTEIIQAEAIGKLPDQNLAEVLENITGIQITRTAGIGSAVQIRGTDDNRIEINGVSTVGSGGLGGGQGTQAGGRSGIDFQDLPASLISSLQVTKVPDAKAVEGTVGGTINLRTIRPLELSERLMSVRLQAEHSDLSDDIVPRFSGTYGDNWELNGGGEIGLVISGSYAEQSVTALRPRVDRDAVVSPGDTFNPVGDAVADDPDTPDIDETDPGTQVPFGSVEDEQFLRIQFFDQRQDIFQLETFNLAGTLEWAPSDNLKFYFDGIYNDQTVNSEGSQVQLSGVSDADVVSGTNNTAFELTDFGTILGPNGPINLGSVQTVTQGILDADTNTIVSGLNPNLRGVSNAGARLTDSDVFSIGGDWEGEKLSISAQASISSADTEAPNLSTTIDFINPNSAQPVIGGSLDNGTPLIFDLTDGALTFGIAPGLDTTPTTEQLLDPANYQLRQVRQGASTGENEEKALRLDFSYDVADKVSFLSSIDVGYRYNENTSDNNNATSANNLTASTGAFNRPNGDQFANIIVAGPDNFDDGDGRDLFIENFLIIDPVLSFDDPDLVRDTLNAAITANNARNDGQEDIFGPDIDLIGTPEVAATASFNIEEETHALYAQANFDTVLGDFPVRGNAGLRWVETSLTSTGATVAVNNGVETVLEVVEDSSYDFFLPRFNLAVDVRDDITLRGGIARDINRPDFGALSTSIIFGSGPNDPVPVGNPDLVPEAVWSYDASAEWYFAPSSLFSIGFFHKERTNLFSPATTFPPENLDDAGRLNIDITSPCEGGGIFNPIANRNINSPIEGTGICTPVTITTNGEGTTTQTGIELALQYDLSGWEDQLGWASGFGFIGNYTYQTTGGSAEDFEGNFADVGGSRGVFGVLGIENAQDQIQLQNLSKNSFNTTLFYEKYGLSARARYTWRSSFQSTDPIQFGVPRVNGSRGQLNGSINYDVTENINVGIEAINLLQTDADQFCVNNNSLLCFNGITDRRIVGGVSINF